MHFRTAVKLDFATKDKTEFRNGAPRRTFLYTRQDENISTYWTGREEHFYIRDRTRRTFLHTEQDEKNISTYETGREEHFYILDRTREEHVYIRDRKHQDGGSAIRRAPYFAIFD
jgi:hypothetical protein